MNYRKIKKAYSRTFGCVFYIKLSKPGKSCKKKSKAITAIIMKDCLLAKRPYLGISGIGMKDR